MPFVVSLFSEGITKGVMRKIRFVDVIRGRADVFAPL